VTGWTYAQLVGLRSAGGVLITGVYGSGKSSVAAEISCLLEQGRQPHALLDLDYLGWGGNNFDDHAAGFGLMLRNLAAVASNYRDAGISVFIVAYFIRDHDALRAVREATAVPLRVVRLSVPLPEIEQRLAADVTSGRQDDLREAASSIAAGEGVGVEDVTVVNDRPVGLVACEVMTWLGWR
jgi:adenylylsulfate kinase